MVFSWGITAAAAMAANVERLKNAERVLLGLALQTPTVNTGQNEHSTNNSSPIIQPFDTYIPINSLLDESSASTCLVANASNRNASKTFKNSYVIHGVSVTANDEHKNMSPYSNDKPLVLIHGYMNGGAYFYRNFHRLSQFFPKIYAIDQLGWGLSSRPQFSHFFKNSLSSNTHLQKDDAIVYTAESFFVESLEAWRKVMGIESMVLAGHSMGGLLAVAYAERYPQHVHHLVLISPAGVPEETEEMIESRAKRTTWRFRLFETLFCYFTPGDVLRMLPESTGQNWIREYIIRRLPAINDPAEQVALSDYLYSLNALLPGSGEYCLPKLLKPSVFGRKPLQYRIPLLDVQSCSFLYGESDWMDADGGLFVEKECKSRKLNGMTSPDIDVYQISRAGHLLMLENSEEFNNAMILALTDKKTTSIDPDHRSEIMNQILSSNSSLPTKLTVTS